MQSTGLCCPAFFVCKTSVAFFPGLKPISRLIKILLFKSPLEMRSIEPRMSCKKHYPCAHILGSQASAPWRTGAGDFPQTRGGTTFLGTDLGRKGASLIGDTIVITSFTSRRNACNFSICVFLKLPLSGFWRLVNVKLVKSFNGSSPSHQVTSWSCLASQTQLFIPIHPSIHPSIKTKPMVLVPRIAQRLRNKRPDKLVLTTHSCVFRNCHI